MGVEYPGALDFIITDPAWVFTDALKGLPGSELSIVLHKTACNNPCTAQSTATFFANDTTNHKSVHFVIGLDGAVVQVVHLKDGAGGNCCLEAGHDAYWDGFQQKYGNLNECTISIEHVDQTIDNSQPMPPAQVAASFALVTWLVQKFNIPISHIKTHASLDPIDKARCPGPTYPMADLIASLTKGDNNVTLILSPSKCVVDLVKSYQLDGGSQDKCGPWSVSELKYAGLPGHGPAGNANQVQAWAHAEYEKYIGPDVVSDQNGSSIDNMHQFLHDAGLHWFDIVAINPSSTQSSDLANVHKALDAGYPVLVTVNEQSVHRRDGSNPYPWQPALGPVNHIFTLVGHTNDGFLLVDDELNPTDNWPVQYSEKTIEMHWACIVQLVGPDVAHPWLKPIPDPATAWPASFNAQNFGTVQPPVPPAPLPSINQGMIDFWNYTGLNLDINSGIGKSWQYHYAHGLFFGPPLGPEKKQSIPGGGTIIIQLFQLAVCNWDGKAHWYGLNGKIIDG